ncbi:hypothetical protein I4U23_031193 [Adineta vaga]|nr:hypothetical protein I4U23_031193 [Adineta vaga]
MKYLPITIHDEFCENGCELRISTYGYLCAFIIFLGIYFIRKCNQYRMDKCLRQYKKTLVKSLDTILIEHSPMIPIPMISIKQDIILNDYYIFSILPNICNIAMDIEVERIIEIRQHFPEQIISLIEEQILVCYCDGSYSHRMKIGHSAFLTSNGTRRYSSVVPYDSKHGSMDSEVLAAYLAIQYAFENCYTKLRIYTDNSKVKQLLQRRKQKDYMRHSDICRMLGLYENKYGQNAIEVIQVPGHPTKFEQKCCKIKQNFAKIDRFVRKKTRQYTRRRWIQFEQTYYVYNTFYPYPVYRVFRYHI